MIRSGQAQFHEALAPLMQPIDSVQPAPYNYNNGDVDAVVESIRTSGMYRPIYVQDSTGDIIAGNHTWMACKELQSWQVPVVRLDISDTEARRIMVADNKIASLAQPDNGLLVDLLERIQEAEGSDLTGTGYTAEEFDVLKLLNDIPLDTEEFGQWPTFSVQVHPNVMRAFNYITRETDDDRQKFELIVRLAGWDGS